MELVNETEWQYNLELSYEANMANWIDAVHFERKRYQETELTHEQAVMKFKELYPRSEYGQT